MPLLGSLAAGSVKGFGAQANLGYFLGQSLRFRAAGSAYLTRTPTTAGNRKTFTYSAWVKVGTIGTWKKMFSAYNAQTDAGYFDIGINNNNVLSIQGWSTAWRLSTQVFRDPSAWYHIVVTIDTTQATASDRIKAYVNGSQITAFSSSSNPTQNYDFIMNNTVAHYIGTDSASGYIGTSNFDGYQTEINFVDGQALDPSYFGKTDPSTGQWIPKKYAGTYGTNGFKLDMSTSGSTVTDKSGNGNNWTATNMNLTTSTATTYDLMNDVPTLTSMDKSNFATWNPLAITSTYPPANGNLSTFTTTIGAYWGTYISNIQIPSTGKWYFEMYLNSNDTNSAIGITDGIKNTFSVSASAYLGAPGVGLSYSYFTNGKIYNAQTGTNYAYGATYTTGDIIGCAYSADDNTLEFFKNGVSQGSFAVSVPTTNYYFAVSKYNTGYMSANFGQRPFAYTPPTGYKKLNTYNL